MAEEKHMTKEPTPFPARREKADVRFGRNTVLGGAGGLWDTVCCLTKRKGRQEGGKKKRGRKRRLIAVILVNLTEHGNI
jgi:hypothetical protein